MNQPTHHVPDEDLLSYAAGTLSAGVELLVACHLTLCPRCRVQLRLAEQIGGSLFGALTPACTALQPTPVAAPASAPATPVGPTPPTRSGVLPAPLRRHVGAIEAVPWRRVGMGVRIADLELQGPEQTFLIAFPPGLTVPSHHHQGTERGLVLQGGFADTAGHYLRGDVSLQEGDLEHHSVIDRDGPCTTLFVMDGPVSVGGALLSRVVDWWLHRS